MISVRKALNALKDEGFIESWKWVRMEEWENLYANIPVLSGKKVKFGMSDETYGKKSFLYFWFDNVEDSKRASRIFLKLGGKPSFRWNGHNKTSFEMQVSYFKGNHWYE